MPQQPDHITIIYTRWYESPSSTNTDMFIIQWEEMLYNGKGVQMGGSKRDRGGGGGRRGGKKNVFNQMDCLVYCPGNRDEENKQTSKQPIDDSWCIVDWIVIEDVIDDDRSRQAMVTEENHRQQQQLLYGNGTHNSHRNVKFIVHWQRLYQSAN